jgi:hypothetical protein
MSRVCTERAVLTETLLSPLLPGGPMATLSWLDVVLIGLVATVGFTLLSYGYSLWMSKRNISYQVKPKPNKGKAPPKEPEAPT